MLCVALAPTVRPIPLIPQTLTLSSSNSARHLVCIVRRPTLYTLKCHTAATRRCTPTGRDTQTQAVLTGMYIVIKTPVLRYIEIRCALVLVVVH